MSGKNEHFENFVLFLVVGGLGLAAVLYGLFLFWPYFVFYVLPFIIVSLLIGGVLRLATVLDHDERTLISHRGLAVAYPILLFVVAMVFFADSRRAVVLDQSGNITATYFDWPKVNRFFNEQRSGTYRGSPFDSLKAKAREVAIYDRQEMGWIFLWCLFLGGPVFFWFLSRRDFETNSAVMDLIVNERSSHKRKILQDKSDNLDQIIAKSTEDFKNKIAELEGVKSALLDENQRLKATVEFSTEIVRPSETPRTGGVLDSDIL